MYTTRTLIATLLASLVCGLAVTFCAGVAFAHEMPDETNSPITGRITSIEPNPGGFDIQVIGSAADIDVHVEPGNELTVLGYHQEPYLRVDQDGNAFVNVNSPSHYINQDPDGAHAPDHIAADAEPDWEWIHAGGAVDWHDHRAHWMATSEPNPDENGVIQRFDIHLIVNDTPVTVSGELIYDATLGFENYPALIGATSDSTQPTAATANEGIPAVLIIVGIAALVIATVAFIVTRASGTPLERTNNDT